MFLTHRQFAVLAKEVDVNPVSCERMLGSVLIPYHEEGVRPERYEIGLRLLGSEPKNPKLSETVFLSSLGDLLCEYRNTCPKIGNWLRSGAFRVHMIPSTISKAELLHGCRTAGRLRAEFLRRMA